jgi:hypothetical protein
MKPVFYAFLVGVLFASGISAQDRTLPGLRSIELLSPFVNDSTGKTIGLDQTRYARSCLDLVTLDHGCDREVSLDFGTQIGINRDLFKVNGGKVDRTRMVLIGKYQWTDNFVVPFIEPWSALAPGERRHLAFNASGGDGADGSPGLPGIAGMNGDGTYTLTAIPVPAPRQIPTREKRKDYATADLTEQVSSKVVGRDGVSRPDVYTPLMTVKEDHIYAVRLIDESRDYYVLIRVDEVVSGDRIKISLLKLDLTVIP